jgi:hypothetical protein
VEFFFSVSFIFSLPRSHSAAMASAILNLKGDLAVPVEEQDDASHGLMALKFMQRALERKRQAAREVCPLVGLTFLSGCCCSVLSDSDDVVMCSPCAGAGAT